MFTLHHRHAVTLDPRLSSQFDRFLDLWERSLDAGKGMTPEEVAAFTRLNNKEAESLEAASKIIDK